MDRLAHFGHRSPRTVSMLTAIVLLGSVVSSPVTSALAVMPLAASPTFLVGMPCDDWVADDTELRATVTQSRDDSVICITADIALSNTLILDDTPLTLVGTAPGVMLQAKPGTRHISANSSTLRDDTLVIDTLTLWGGNLPDTGGIFVNNYAIEIRNSSLRENNAVADGGAIYATNGDVTIDDSTTFTNNSADDPLGVGGAIYVFGGDVTINGNSTFIENTAAFSGGAIYAANGHVTITDTTAFTDNDAANGYGGAIYADDTVTTSGGTFSDNDALLSGGAIFANTGNVTVDDSTTFTNNSADDTIGFGGAIYAKGDVTINGTTEFAYNQAGEGGAIYAQLGDLTTSDSTFTENIAGGRGGAIYTDAGG